MTTNIWDRLSGMDGLVLAKYFSNEYPQTVAVALSNLAAEKRGEVLSYLPENFAMEVMMRLARLERVRPEVLAIVEASLQRYLEFSDQQPDNVELLREAFQHMDASSRLRYASAIEERNRELALQVTRPYVIVSNAQYFSKEQIQAIVQKADRKFLFMALMGMGEEVRKAFAEYVPELELVNGMSVMSVENSMAYLASLIENDEVTE